MDEEIKKEEKVTEAEVEEIEEIEKEEKEEMSEENVVRKKKREFYFELALFLILGILIGIAVKTEASKRITIGYEDYKMKIKKQDYSIDKLQAELNKITEEAQLEEESQVAPQEDNSQEEAQAPEQSRGEDASVEGESLPEPEAE